jgi:hypothetical protein
MKYLYPLLLCWIASAAVADEPGKPDMKPLSQAEREGPVCLTETGSRIRPPEGQCINAPGRVYRRDDLDRTGERDLANALQKLDPSVSVGR